MATTNAERVKRSQARSRKKAQVFDIINRHRQESLRHQAKQELGYSVRKLWLDFLISCPFCFHVAEVETIGSRSNIVADPNWPDIEKAALLYGMRLLTTGDVTLRYSAGYSSRMSISERLVRDVEREMDALKALRLKDADIFS